MRTCVVKLSLNGRKGKTNKKVICQLIDSTHVKSGFK